MSPTSVALLMAALLAVGLVAYLYAAHTIKGAEKRITVETLEQLAKAVESGGAALPRKASLENVDSWIMLGPRRYSVELARLAFRDCHVYLEPRGRDSLEAWGNWTSCGLASTPVFKGGIIEFYTANATGEVGAVKVSGNRTVLVAWVDSVETPWWSVRFGGPVRIVVVEKVLTGH